MITPRLYHGGKPGLRIGDVLDGSHEREPVDGCEWCVARANGTAIRDPASAEQNRLYVTADREYARYYASLYRYGDLYRVEPLGELRPSTEDHWPCWTVERARVAGIVDRAVLLTPNQRRRLTKKWQAFDLAKSPLAAPAVGVR